MRLLKQLGVFCFVYPFNDWVFVYKYPIKNAVHLFIAFSVLWNQKCHQNDLLYLIFLRFTQYSRQLRMRKRHNPCNNVLMSIAASSQLPSGISKAHWHLSSHLKPAGKGRSGPARSDWAFQQTGHQWKIQLNAKKAGVYGNWQGKGDECEKKQERKERGTLRLRDSMEILRKTER